MKSIPKLGTMKAIAFMAAALFLISCFTSCRPDEPLIKAVVTIEPAENVTETSATLVAMVTPNTDPTTVTFRYKLDQTEDWKSVTLLETYSGTVPKKVTCIVKDLVAGAGYYVEATATNAAGSVTRTGVFLTGSYVKAKAVVTSISEIKMDCATIYFAAIPNQSNTTISLEYQIDKSSWQSKEMGTNFSGKDSIKLNWTLRDLPLNTKINVRVKVNNIAGEVISYWSSFTTYAVADWDGNMYHTVTIGTQTWLKENFRGTHYANGDAIAHVTDLTEWSKLSTGAYCYYNNDPSNAKVYGGLYNWYVGADPRGLIVGWHTPSGDEFVVLGNYLGGVNQAGPAVMDNSGLYWRNLTKSYRQATNSSGLSIVPNGDVNRSNSTFGDFGTSSTLWASSADNDNQAENMIIDSPDISFGICQLFSAKEGFGLRLLRN